MTDFDLLRAYRSLMSQLSLLGDGHTAKLDSDRVKGGEKSGEPSGSWAKWDGLPLVEQFRREWGKASGRDAQWDLIRRYEHLREEFRKAKDAPAAKEETWDQLRKRVIAEGKGWDRHLVALSMRITASQVHKARVETARELCKVKAYGKPKYTVREISEITSLPKSTVHDESKRAA